MWIILFVLNLIGFDLHHWIPSDCSIICRFYHCDLEPEFIDIAGLLWNDESGRRCFDIWELVNDV